MLINRKAVMQLVHSKGKQIDREAILIIDKMVEDIVLKAVARCNGCKRITGVEVTAK